MSYIYIYIYIYIYDISSLRVNINFNVNFKFVFKTIQLCISWWKNFDNYQDARYAREKINKNTY